jgi:hypothetical protein
MWWLVKRKEKQEKAGARKNEEKRVCGVGA